MEYVFYIGSVITVTDIPVLMYKKYKRVCLNDDRHNITNGSFCPICGSKVEDKEYIIEGEAIIMNENDFSEKFVNYEKSFIPKSNKYHKMIDDTSKDLKLETLKFDLEDFKEYAKDLLSILDKNEVKYEISNIIKPIYLKIYNKQVK